MPGRGLFDGNRLQSNAVDCYRQDHAARRAGSKGSGGAQFIILLPFFSASQTCNIILFARTFWPSVVDGVEHEWHVRGYRRDADK